MHKLGSQWGAYSPQLRSVLRIVAALMFMSVGTMKLFAFPVGMPPNGAAAAPLTLYWFAGVLEVYGGGLVLLGLFTRPIAFILAGEMAYAYFHSHFPQSPWPAISGGMPACLFSFIWLYISAAGAGPWSLDALLLRRRSPPKPTR